jgi:hypothetical protein
MSTTQVHKEHSRETQLDFTLNQSPNGRTRYFTGREDTLLPRILASPPKSSMVPTETNSDLTKLIFNPEIASKPKKIQHK